MRARWVSSSGVLAFMTGGWEGLGRETPELYCKFDSSLASSAEEMDGAGSLSLKEGGCLAVARPACNNFPSVFCLANLP